MLPQSGAVLQAVELTPPPPLSPHLTTLAQSSRLSSLTFLPCLDSHLPALSLHVRFASTSASCTPTSSPCTRPGRTASTCSWCSSGPLTATCLTSWCQG
jgi:hypothetical protein